jgi:GMP synthase (glutamine-hydrolysing)
MIGIIDFGSSKVPFIEKAVDEYMDFETIHHEEFRDELLNKYKGVILSGAPRLITEVDMSGFINKFAWLKQVTLPVLGICFGHQIIGLVHGAFGSRMREDRDWQEIEFYKEDPIFARLPKVVQMMEDHCEAISIPNGFELIASSDSCVNEGMKHQKKLLYGVQFHPEVSGNMGYTLIENFIKICETGQKSHSGV